MNIRRKQQAEQELHREIEGAHREIRLVKRATEEQRRRLIYLEKRLATLRGEEGG